MHTTRPKFSLRSWACSAVTWVTAAATVTIGALPARCQGRWQSDHALPVLVLSQDDFFCSYGQPRCLRIGIRGKIVCDKMNLTMH